MRDVLAEVDRWLSEGERVALATVVRVWGSAPRQPGSRMAISSAARIAGSVSGGCVEAAVVEEALVVLESGEPRRVRYGITDEQAWAIGLSCGGTLEVFVEPFDPEDPALLGLRRCLEADAAAVLATVVAGPGTGRRCLIRAGKPTIGDLGSEVVDDAAAASAGERLRSFGTERLAVETGAGVADVFVEAFRPRPRLVIVGGSHVAIPLVGFARALGFETIVVDPRPAFATAERFPDADHRIVDWPQDALPALGLDEESYVAVLSHDPKIDVPALAIALRGPARYVGMLGSTRTREKRVGELREHGLTETEIARLRSPIGLDLGGRRPEEIAVAIVAEIVAVTHGR